ncbi:MAG: hypothetical protein F6K58_05860 [Symploca sp. SIO2E9]|nr:hypothetical protein [Symploca sp. SIO2E9]
MSQPPNEESQPAGNSPAQSQANLNQLVAHSLGLAVENAVAAQQQGFILQQAATTIGIAQLYSNTQGSAADQNLLKTLEQIQKVAETFKDQGSSQGNP